MLYEKPMWVWKNAQYESILVYLNNGIMISGNGHDMGPLKRNFNHWLRRGSSAQISPHISGNRSLAVAWLDRLWTEPELPTVKMLGWQRVRPAPLVVAIALRDWSISFRVPHDIRRYPEESNGQWRISNEAFWGGIFCVQNLHKTQGDG